MSQRQRRFLEDSEQSAYPMEVEETKHESKHISGARIVGESIVVFIVSYIILYAIGYFFMPDYIVSGGKHYVHITKVYSGIGLLSLIIALIYAAVRAKRRA